MLDNERVSISSNNSNFHNLCMVCVYLITKKTKSMTGVIKKLTEKGFGFITSEGLGKDLFFHMNSLVDVRFDDLQEGDNVSFDTEDSPKGMNAVNVKRV